MPTTRPRLTAPNRLTYLDHSADVGATVYRALALVLPGRPVAVRDLYRAVWGGDYGDGVRSQLWSLCHRVNRKLTDVGYPGRLILDGDSASIC